MIELYLLNIVYVLQDAKSPTLFVAVASLPKGSLVEKQVLLNTGRFEVLDEDGDKELKVLTPKVETGESPF